MVESLTELVIEAFNIEHHQFKEILNKFTTYLQNFGTYLQLSNENNIQSQQDSEQLEKNLHQNIKAIRGDIDRAETIEMLSLKISKKLDLIAEQMNTFRSKEAERVKGYEEQIVTLQSKLIEAESGVESIKQQLSVHKIKVNEDPLTGLPNRSAYDEFIVNAFNRWKRGFGEVALALADIDHFKAINDKYGHLAGDKVLKKVATIFRDSLRAVDFVARYGGEEFVFIFEHTAAYDGWKVLENLRIAIEETEFCYRDQQVLVTASFGITALQHGDDIESLFVRTDEAMYQAKNSGRNKVIVV
jgi:diguanylate cyclase (GGDEF)-like protein